MSKSAKRSRSRAKRGQSGAATALLVCALGAGFVIGLAGFQMGSKAYGALSQSQSQVSR